MAATLGLNQADYSGKKIVTDNGDGTGALNVITNGGADVPITTAAQTSVAASASSVQLLAANTSRKGASVYNDSDKAMYLKYGTTASTSSFKVKIAIGGFFAFPLPIYTGRVDAIWDSGPTGNARISEET